MNSPVAPTNSLATEGANLMYYSMNHEVRQGLTFELLDPAGTLTPIDTDLIYDPCDPYAVKAVFHVSGEEVSLTFARDLLIEGFYEPLGDGHVRVWPSLDADGRAAVIIKFYSLEGEMVVRVYARELMKFVRRMTGAVAQGDEPDHVDIDTVISEINTAETD